MSDGSPHPMLPDGTYDAFIVDADEDTEGLVHLSVTILTGEHKSEVLDLTAEGMERDAIDLIGMPATLSVEDGTPRLTVDD